MFHIFTYSPSLVRRRKGSFLIYWKHREYYIVFDKYIQFGSRSEYWKPISFCSKHRTYQIQLEYTMPQNDTIWYEIRVKTIRKELVWYKLLVSFVVLPFSVSQLILNDLKAWNYSMMEIWIVVYYAYEIVSERDCWHNLSLIVNQFCWYNLG